MFDTATMSSQAHQPKAQGEKKTVFLRYVHYMRGIAILNIVFVHVMFAPENLISTNEHNFLALVREVLFHASTLYFLFISGFLFYHLSSRFNLKKYFKGKLSFVIAPYFIITTILTIISIVVAYKTDGFSFFESGKLYVGNLIFGRGQLQFWYIPFICILFLISPLILKIPNKFFKPLLLVSLVLPLLGTRTSVYITVYQIIYFLPIYFIGIYAAKNLETFLQIINKYAWVFFIVALSTTIYLFTTNAEPVILYPTLDITEADTFLMRNTKLVINLTEGVYYIQKLSTCFLLFLILYRMRKKEYKLLDAFAQYSFAIYFLHKLVHNLLPLDELMFGIGLKLSHNTFTIIAISIVYAITISLTTLGICVLLKKSFGKFSRYLIGA